MVGWGLVNELANVYLLQNNIRKNLVEHFTNSTRVGCE
jgi:hypothetical protein